jgi:predicted ATP-grasp superfamily ATP-dependent carboligase
MTDTPRYVHIVDDVPELAETGANSPGPVLVVALDGFLDAGNAGRLAVDHLLGSDPGRVVASLDIDAFFDYRARRPPLRFVEDHYEGYSPPRLVTRLQRDVHGAPYLLLHGPEPDTHWEAFARSVREVVEHFGVRLSVSLGSVPMAVPHSRPVMVTNHATRPELLMTENIWRGVIQVPSSAASMLEVRMGEWGHDAMGFVAHVPHYVSQADYPAAGAKLLESLEVVSGLQWELEPMNVAARNREVEIAQHIADSPEVAQVVSGLEQQYDAFSRADEGGLPLAEERDLPTGDELGAEFERFLAGLDSDDD